MLPGWTSCSRDIFNQKQTSCAEARPMGTLNSNILLRNVECRFKNLYFTIGKKNYSPIWMLRDWYTHLSNYRLKSVFSISSSIICTFESIYQFCFNSISLHFLSPQKKPKPGMNLQRTNHLESDKLVAEIFLFRLVKKTISSKNIFCG